jgi:hypothetical protein
VAAAVDPATSMEEIARRGINLYLPAHVCQPGGQLVRLVEDFDDAELPPVVQARRGTHCQTSRREEGRPRALPSIWQPLNGELQ